MKIGEGCITEKYRKFNMEAKKKIPDRIFNWARKFDGTPFFFSVCCPFKIICYWHVTCGTLL